MVAAAFSGLRLSRDWFFPSGHRKRQKRFHLNFHFINKERVKTLEKIIIYVCVCVGRIMSNAKKYVQYTHRTIHSSKTSIKYVGHR
jgi:hypothetical protein